MFDTDTGLKLSVYNMSRKSVSRRWSSYQGLIWKKVTFKIFPEILGSICDGVLEPAMVPTTLLKKDYMAGIFLEFCEIYNSVNKLTCNCESLLLQLLWVLFTLERYFHENNRNSMKKQSSGGVLRNFAKFTEKHLCQSLSFNQVAGLQLYWKRDSSGRGFFL